MQDERATVDDVVFDGPDGLPVSAFLVRPGAPAGGTTGGNAAGAAAGAAAILAWHWLDGEAPDGDRTQFLDEARAWAALGVVSLLPQGRFPWVDDPTGATADLAAIGAEVGRLRAGLDRLVAEPGIDPGRLAVVGHDFGGMLAAVAAAEEDRIRALVMIAATPRWGDWFLPFWQIADDRIDYLRALRPLDPIECLPRAIPARVLLQAGLRDFYIAPMSSRELHRAAPDGTELRSYDTGHDMRLAEIRTDRLAFLREVLGLGDGPAVG